MKRSLSAVAAILVLCISVLLSGCREGGAEFSSGYSSVPVTEEFNIGERTDAVSSSSVISPEISTGKPESTSTSTTPISTPSVDTPTSVSSPEEPIIIVYPISSIQSQSSPQSSVSATLAQSSSAQIIVVVPEEPPEGVSDGENEPPPETGTDPNAVPAAPELPEESTEVSSSESETSVSPYEYEGTVYIASSGNGKRYHLNPNCSNMKGTIAMEVPEALKKGYTPCKKCWDY